MTFAALRLELEASLALHVTRHALEDGWEKKTLAIGALEKILEIVSKKKKRQR